MEALAPPRKKSRPDVFLNGNAPFRFPAPELDLHVYNPSDALAFRDSSRFKPPLQAFASERESLSTGLGSKSKACLKFFSTSGCPYGEGCHFAHYMPGGMASSSLSKASSVTGGAAVGVRKGPLVSTGLLTSLVSPVEQGSVPGGYKTRLCKNFGTSEGCQFADKCHFAHGEKELRNQNGSLLIMEGGTGGFARKGPLVSVGLSTSLVSPLDQGSVPGGYKSRLCKNYETKEGCHFGEKCHFAHGEKELRSQNGSVQMERMDLFPSSLVRSAAGISDDKVLRAFREPTPPGLTAAASFGAVSTAKISIDASLAGFIIGKGGINSKSICRVTGAKLSIMDHDSDSSLKNIEMEGSFEQIKQASAMVRELLVHKDATPIKTGGSMSQNYKTKLCENFPKGSCTYGERCHFAHDTSELRVAMSL